MGRHTIAGLGNLSPILGGLSALNGIINSFGAAQARQHAIQAQNTAIDSYQRAGMGQYDTLLNRQAQDQYSAAGQGGDALRDYGANLGAALTGAGVYNSSATAGALARFGQTEQQNLANLASQNYYTASNDYDGILQNAARMRLGLADQQYQQSIADQGNAQGSLASLLGSIAQWNLGQSGANAQRAGLPSVNGTSGQAPALPGNANSAGWNWNPLGAIPGYGGALGPQSADVYDPNYATAQAGLSGRRRAIPGY